MKGREVPKAGSGVAIPEDGGSGEVKDMKVREVAEEVGDVVEDDHISGKAEVREAGMPVEGSKAAGPGPPEEASLNDATFDDATPVVQDEGPELWE